MNNETRDKTESFISLQNSVISISATSEINVIKNILNLLYSYNTTVLDSVVDKRGKIYINSFYKQYLAILTYDKEKYYFYHDKYNEKINSFEFTNRTELYECLCDIIDTIKQE